MTGFDPHLLYVVITVFGLDIGVAVQTDRFFHASKVGCEAAGKQIEKKHRWKVTRPHKSGFSPVGARKVRSIVRWNCLPIQGKLVGDPRGAVEP